MAGGVSIAQSVASDSGKGMDESLLKAMKGVVDDLYGHVHRVSDLATALGKEMSLPRDDVKRLGLVGILHDVGKIHIDPGVLAKPGPLDEVERDHMRQHPEIGYAMIAEKFDRRVSEAILYHHERYDGLGYPFGLAGTKIPILSRIVLVADAYDAITSHRAYQPALSVDFAISEIINNSGTQFDPGVVEAFLTVIERDGVPTSKPDDRSKERARVLKRLTRQNMPASRDKTSQTA